VKFRSARRWSTNSEENMDYSNVDASQIVFDANKAYQTGDIDRLRDLIPQIVGFIEYTTADETAIQKMQTNHALVPLRKLQKNVEEGIIEVNDHADFVDALKFVSATVLLPRLRKEIPEVVKDAGLWTVTYDNGE